MLLRCGLLFAILSCVQPKDLHRDGLLGNPDNDFGRYSLWPSFHNGGALMRIRRANQIEETQVVQSPAGSPGVQGPNEGDAGQAVDAAEIKPLIEQPTSAPPVSNEDKATKLNLPLVNNANNSKNDSQIENSKNLTEISNKTPKAVVADTSKVSTVNSTNVEVKDNGTTAEKAAKEWDLSNPAATKRGLIVFGGFALLAMAYFIFYRTKSKYNEAGNTNGTSESNQFRYGVLQSDDRRDNLELSRVPLTMESDEEEDEDLEIFDLGQKKKSLSYVNLQGTDEDIVLSRVDDGKDELLLDIDDDNSDVLINWSTNGKKT